MMTLKVGIPPLLPVPAMISVLTQLSQSWKRKLVGSTPVKKPRETTSVASSVQAWKLRFADASIQSTTRLD